MASSASGSSLTERIRLKSSRQESPASTRMRVREVATMALLPLEPLASTVIRTMLFRILPIGVEERENCQGGTCLGIASSAEIQAGFRRNEGRVETVR